MKETIILYIKLVIFVQFILFIVGLLLAIADLFFGNFDLKNTLTVYWQVALIAFGCTILSIILTWVGEWFFDL